MNFKWIRENHETLDYFERWVERLPINPPGFAREGDVIMDSVGIINWDDEFRPRLSDEVRKVSRVKMALDDEAPELDEELFDCD